jgi:hypothetical protein
MELQGETKPASERSRDVRQTRRLSLVTSEIGEAIDPLDNSHFDFCLFGLCVAKNRQLTGRLRRDRYVSPAYGSSDHGDRRLVRKVKPALSPTHDMWLQFTLSLTQKVDNQYSRIPKNLRACWI